MVVHSTTKYTVLTTYNDNSFALSDAGDSYIKPYKPTAKQFFVVVGERWKKSPVFPANRHLL